MKKNHSAATFRHKIIQKIGLVCLFFSLLAGDVFSQTSGSRKLLIFSARRASSKPFSFAGHAFVSWASQKTPHSKVVAPTTLGLFPEKNSGFVELIVGGLPAEVVAGFRPNSHRVRTFQAIFEFEATPWKAALDTAKSWHGRGYFLFGRNCVSFMDAVAEAAGMDTPATRLWCIFPRRPLVYLRKLTRRNPAQRVFIHTPIRYEYGQLEPQTFSLEPQE